MPIFEGYIWEKTWKSSICQRYRSIYINIEVANIWIRCWDEKQGIKLSGPAVWQNSILDFLPD